MASLLEGNVKIPGVGEVPKIAVGGGLAVTGYLIWRARTKSAAAAAPSPGGATADPYPSDGTIGNPNDPYSVDPATGVTYGDESVGYSGNQVAPSSQNAGDAYPWDGTYNNPDDPYSMDTSSGTTYGDEGFSGGSGGSGGTSGGPPFSTNAQWSQYAITTLTTDDPGVNVGQLTTALGAYIAGGKVTTAQESLIQQAIAVAGTPPVAGAGGNPPGINVGGSKAGGGTKAANPVSGLKVSDADYTSVTLTWQPSEGASGYSVRGGPNVVRTDSATARVGNLARGHSYTFTVVAHPAGAGAKLASVKATTKK